jgi:hypothetical protein
MNSEVLDLSESAPVDPPLELEQSQVKSKEMSHHEPMRGGLGGKNFGSVLHGGGERLLDQNVLALLQCKAGRFHMEMIRQRHGNGIGRVEDLLERSAGRDPKSPLGLRAAIGIDVDRAYHLNIAQVLENPRMQHAHEPHPDHRYTYHLPAPGWPTRR